MSVRVVTDGSGSVVGRQATLPYGEGFALSGENDKHNFTSYERDAETWLDYAINRAYSPNIGRFTRPDPLRGSCNLITPQSLNRYTYVQNDPVNSVDPLGLLTSCPPGTTPLLDRNGLNLGCVSTTNPADILPNGGLFNDLGTIPISPEPPPPVLYPPVTEVSEDLYGDLNPCELKALKQTGALEEAGVYFARKRAEKVEEELWGNTDSPDGSYPNAVKHCVWSCEMVRLANFKTAKMWGDAHECNRDGKPMKDEQALADLHNNDVGRRLADQKGSCSSLCQNTGGLKVIRPPYGPHHPPK
jgi:RHS repeat-associated protein